MAYDPTIPKPTDKLSASQSALLNNFAEINAFVNVNHGAFESNNPGKHKFVTLVSQGDPLTNNTEIALYSKEGTTPGQLELHMRRQNNGTIIDMTSATLATSGWTRLPSGLLLRWNIKTLAGPGPAAVTYAGGAFPGFSAIPFTTYLQIVSALVDDSNRVVVLSASGYSAAGFSAWVGQRDANGVPATSDFFWMSVGI